MPELTCPIPVVQEIVDPSDEEDGWILACRSKPKSRFIEISFDE